MASTVFNTSLREKIPRAANIVSFRFDRPSGYEYAAGQWHVVTIPARPEALTHHFTHSSSPTEPFLELTTRLRGTEFKNALDALPLGTMVEMEGPFGSFTVDAGAEESRPAGGKTTAPQGTPADRKVLVFITGGIGITPVRSILRWQADAGLGRRAILLYANSSEQAIAFREELDSIAQTLSDLRVVYVVSRPSPSWIGRRGHIDAAMLADELGDLTRGDLARGDFYVSGPPSMVQALRDILVNQGVDRALIKTERFEGYE